MNARAGPGLSDAHNVTGEIAIALGARLTEIHFQSVTRKNRHLLIAWLDSRMSEEGETAAARLWRDRAEIREQERNEALAQARLAEATCAVLVADNERLRLENERLTLELARLRAFASPDPKQPETEIEVQMDALRTALLEVLVSSEGSPKAPGSPKYVDQSGNGASDLSVKPLEEELRLPPATWDFPTAHMSTRATSRL